MNRVVVPADHRSLVIAPAVWREANRDYTDADFDEPPSQQALLSRQVTSIAVANLWLLASEVERPRRPATGQQIDRLLAKSV